MATNELLKQGTLLDVLNNRAPDGNLLVVAEVYKKKPLSLKMPHGLKLMIYSNIFIHVVQNYLRLKF